MKKFKLATRKIRKLIDTDLIKLGTELPPVSTLAKKFKVSVTTINHSISELLDLGMIEKQSRGHLWAVKKVPENTIKSDIDKIRVNLLAAKMINIGGKEDSKSHSVIYCNENFFMVLFTLTGKQFKIAKSLLHTLLYKKITLNDQEHNLAKIKYISILDIAIRNASYIFE